MTNLSLLLTLKFFQTCSLFLVLNTEKYILKNPCNQTVTVAIDFCIMEWLPLTVWLLTFFKIMYFVFNRRKKFIQVWKQLEGKKMITQCSFLGEL